MSALLAFLSLAKGLAGPFLKNPYVIGFLVALGLVLVVKVEEGGKASIRAKDARVIAGYQADLDTVLKANATLLQSLKWQTSQVKALAAESARKTLAAQKAQAAAQKAVDAASVVARHVDAYKGSPGSSDAQNALDILKGRAD